MDERKTLREKKETLEAQLRQCGRVAVAFSAGVDSTFLLHTAHEVLGDNVIALTGRTVSTPEREMHEAADFCKALGVRHVVADVDQMAIPGFADNPPERCYICKKALFTAFLQKADDLGFPVLVEGTNADDTSDYRPGLRALRELHVRSPLLEAGLTKREIRLLSREAGLETWDKPSLACLATRIPCGDAITPEKLAVIDEAEQFLRDKGLHQVRVRMHGGIARIETDPADFSCLTDPALRQETVRRLRELGFGFVTLDLAGYVSGSMNSIQKESL